MTGETFVFFGRDGSGKGTQVKLLRQFLEERDGKDIVYAYPGDQFRRLIGGGSYTGSLIKDSLIRGELQPDFLTNSIFTDILISSLSPEKHLIADGYPRTVVQSETFDAMMHFFKRENVKVVYVELSKEEGQKRNASRGRHDDTPESFERRAEEFENNILPAMYYFKDKENYRIYKINGEQSVEDVHKDIIISLGY